MKKNLPLTILFTIILTGCNFKIDYKKIVPTDIDSFAKDFIGFVQKGNIDSCLTLVLPEMNTDEGQNFLQTSHLKIYSLNLDSSLIINASKTSLMGKDGFTNYWIDYEYNTKPKFLYFKIGIREQNKKLIVTAFDGTILDQSLSETHKFDLQNKGAIQYLFLSLALLVPIFILVTLVATIRTGLDKKWLWIIGIIFGFSKFSLNWTTGQVGFNLINISILGSGIVKSGNVSPWILSFSLPIVAIIFWVKKYSKNRADGKLQQNDEIKTMSV